MEKFQVFVEQDEDGILIGKVPAVKGCLTQGETLEELKKNIKDAIELCIEKKIMEEQIEFGVDAMKYEAPGIKI